MTSSIILFSSTTPASISFMLVAAFDSVSLSFCPSSIFILASCLLVILDCLSWTSVGQCGISNSWSVVLWGCGKLIYPMSLSSLVSCWSVIYLFAWLPSPSFHNLIYLSFGLNVLIVYSTFAYLIPFLDPLGVFISLQHPVLYIVQWMFHLHVLFRILLQNFHVIYTSNSYIFSVLFWHRK